MKNIKISLIILCLLPLVGCYRYTANLDYQPTPIGNTALKVVNKIPDRETSAGVESSLVTSCKYGARRVPDADLTPDRFDIIRSELSKRLGDVNAEIIVNHFTIHYNKSRELRGGMSMQFTGVIPDAMINQPVGCSGDDLIGGYLLEEAASNRSPLIIVIEVSYNGTAFRERGFFEPPEGTPDWRKFAGTPQWADFVGKSILTTVSGLIDQLENSLPGGSAGS